MAVETCQVLILGAGPAGLQAALHAARSKVSVIVLGRTQRSSLFRAHVENFCCLGAHGGEELLAGGRAQAEDAGARILEEDVVEAVPAEGGFQARTETGMEIHARSLILAMGISRNRLGVPGEKELLGRGVSYCVECDGNFFRGKKVAVAGGASSAAAGALTLLMLASEVHLIAPELEVAETAARHLRASAVRLHEGRRVVRILGQDKVEGIELNDGTELAIDGLFIELGARGADAFAASLGVDLDSQEMRFIAVNRAMETNVPGVFAAGDITGPPWQVAKAVGEGCVAGLGAASHAKKAN